MTDIDIRPMAGRRGVADWLDVPDLTLPPGSPYVRPLDFLEKRRLARKHNPFFTFADAEFFIAYRGGRPIGRISAQVNRRHIEQHGEGHGHFGFLDTLDDAEVAETLLAHAGQWLRARGMRDMTGPFNLSINEESGMLVDGFDLSPQVMMPYSAPWQGGLAERAGLARAMDLYAYRCKPNEMPPIITWLADSAMTEPSVSFRSLDMGHFDDELMIIADIFNDAWSENWGFIPFSKADMDYLFGDLKIFIRSQYAKFLLVNGKPEGFAFAVPNLNEIIRDFSGRLMPFNWAKLLYNLSFERFRSGRLPLMGLRKAYHGTSRGIAMFAALVKSSMRDVSAYTLDEGEFSWVLESNKPLVTFLRTNFGPPTTTYRLYSCSLEDKLAPPFMNRVK